MTEEDINLQLYAKIMDVMRHQKPYQDHQFNLNRLANLISSNRTYVSHAINYISGKNFHAWIADYRNVIILQAINDIPDSSINYLCAISGYSCKETFCRQFKKINGMTFTKFKSNN